MPDTEHVITIKDRISPLNHWQWWTLALVNISLVVIGQCAGVLLGRFYYDQGGNSTWMATLLQSVGFPILVPFLFVPSFTQNSANPASSPSLPVVSLIYVVLGTLIAVDNMLYSVGLLYLSASTYSLICATQLAFNVVFSFFLNAQKLTPLILNSVVVLSLSATLIALNDDSDKPLGTTHESYILGFLITLSASALLALSLSLTQLSFEKVIKKESFSVALEMQIWTSAVATCVSLAGLFGSGEWRVLGGEMAGFRVGSWAYVVTLACAAVAWQLCCVGVVGLVFLASSLFANVISTLSLAVTPLAAFVVFRDTMSGVKIVAMVMASWGFATYLYQNYVDDLTSKEDQGGATGSNCSQESTPLLLQSN